MSVLAKNRVLLLSLLTVAALSGPCLAVAGGRDGGGGNIQPNHELSYGEVQAYVRMVNGMLPYVFNTVQLMTYPSSKPIENPENSAQKVLPTTYPKLFINRDGTGTIFDLIPKVTYVLLPSGACPGFQGKDEDGGAPYQKPNQICLSYDRIKTKIDSGSVWKKLTGLMAREVSHLKKTNEDEAASIQWLVELNVSDSSFTDFTNRNIDLQSDLKDVQTDLDATVSEMNPVSTLANNCEDLTALQSKIGDFQKAQSRNLSDGITLLNVKDQYKLIAAEISVALSTTTYCESSVDAKNYFQALFNHQPIANLYSIAVRENEASNTPTDVLNLLDRSTSIYYVGHGDTAALKKELQIIQSLLMDVRTSAAKINSGL